MANIYYVSSTTGSDSNNGTSTATPWASLAKVTANNSSLTSGSIVYFKSGDTFTGSLTVNANGNASGSITFTNYGSDSLPILSGFTTIPTSSWGASGSNIYTSSVLSPTSSVKMVVIDGVQYGMGRYPAANAVSGGYISISAVSGGLYSGSFTSSAVLPYNYSGGTAIIRTYHYRLEPTTITSQSANTLYYSGSLTLAPSTGWGFFIQNHPSTLANFGDWYYDTGNNTLRVYFGASNPASHSVQVATVDNLVTIQSGYNIFSGLAFQGANLSGITAQTLKLGMVVQSCSFQFMGTDALSFSNQNGALVTNNTFNYCNNSAINFSYQNYNVTASNNTITNVGLIAGAGLRGIYTGLVSTQGGLLINNNISNIGYCGISLAGSSSVVQNNYVNNCCIVADDGGCIYFNGTGSSPSNNIFSNNIVSNAVGNSYGTNTSITSTPWAHGIYFDYPGTGYTCTGNTSFNNGWSGIYVHNNWLFTASNNTLYNNGNGGRSQFYIGTVGTTPIPVTGSITNNIFFATTSSQECFQYDAYSVSNDALLTASLTLDYNVYARPTSETGSINISYASSNHYYSFLTFQSLYTSKGYESHGTITPTGYLSTSASLYYNTSSISQSITLPNSSIDMLGNYYSAGNVTLSPYSSLLVLPYGTLYPYISVPYGSIVVLK